jgi:formylglycine-generating enzyme required for sulfatase activity
MARLRLVLRLIVFTTLLTAASVLILAIGGAAHAVTIDWVTVGDPGNAADTEVMTCCLGNIGTSGFGAVPYTYQIGKYEVTNAQYAEFLNAVAETDTNDLYSTAMATPDSPHFGGITRSGTSGSYTYSTIAGREDMPVNNVSFYDSLRFVNWLENGQPTGAQDSTTTEDGAYTLLGGTPLPSNYATVARNAGATIVLPSEDEWYKAAYYDAVSTSYFDYPVGTDTQTICAPPGATPNTASCDYAVDNLTDGGSYTGSPSPYGTFDQGGNIAERNETRIAPNTYIVRGGHWHNPLTDLAAASRREGTGEGRSVGFRVAMIPEPSTALLLAFGLVGLAVGQRRR